MYYSAAMNANFAEHFCCWFYYYFKPDSPNLAGIRELPSNKIQLQFGLEGMAATRANFQLLRRALACSNKNIQKYVHICKNIIANIQTLISQLVQVVLTPSHFSVKACGLVFYP